ncbi:MAG: AAA family ATPase [Candidatus Tectimicrobiota bacterium]
MMANPGGYIPPHEVVGRDQLIAQLWRRLARQSLVLTAERRMGKTSILRKMEAEHPPDMLVVYHELEHINTPLEFVQLVYDDVHTHLSRSQRTARRVREFLQNLGGLEVGDLIKFPEASAPAWKALLTHTIADLLEHQEHTLLFLWDEMPMMLGNITRYHGEPLAEELLNTLRAMRQTHAGFRMVFTGSIGLHHVLTSLKRAGYANDPTNDMYKVDVPPLTPQDAQLLAQRLIEGENLQAENPACLARSIAAAVDHCPYYIHHIVERLCQEPAPTPVAEIVDDCLTASNDPWDLRHYRERIATYYLPEELPFVLHLLDILATASAPLPFDSLFERLKASCATEDAEMVRAVLGLLHEDHYVTRQRDGTWQWRFALIQRWWRLERGLGV